MRGSEFSTGYIVEISAPAWEELARLPLERYQRVRNELEAVASRLLMGPSPSAFAPEVSGFGQIGVTPSPSHASISSPEK